MWSCSWPHQLRHSSSSMSRLNVSGNYVKVAVLTDPQIMDRTSLHLAPKSFLLETAEFYTDIFMRRVFLSSILPFKPDVVLFLGDYFDGGLILSDEEWQESLSRFKHIFNLDMLRQSPKTEVHFLSGNHDIGYTAFHSQMPEVIRRYEKEFGPRNYKLTVGSVDFVAIDAQTVDGNSQREVTSETWNFALHVSKESNSKPRVLLTHMPLYRPDWTSCGPYRSSPVINQRISLDPNSQQISYQNYVTAKSSNQLLNLIRPVLILSGHDHDQCTVTHTPEYGPVVEHTLGTVSWQQGNLYPSFMLLSVSNHTLPNGLSLEDIISTHLCFLPVQTFIYIWYLVLLVMTLVIVLLWPKKGVSFSYFRESVRNMRSGSMFGQVMKEKNEDEGCQYEMIWDAEGMMHLIKQPSEAPPRYSSEAGSVGRGKAVMRSAAAAAGGRRLIEEEMEEGGGVASVLSIRKKKSKRKIVVQRLVRMVRVVTFIAAVNVPLYMMLIFKDWI